MRDRDPAIPDGIRAAFEAEAMPHVDRLFRLAMWWERDRREAEGLMQETLVRALQSFHRFTTGTSCHAWLVSILRHVRMRNTRRQSQFSRLAPEHFDDRAAENVPFTPPVPQHLSDEDVLAALREIPEAYQDIILLCDVERMTYAEIAVALTIPIGTVMSRVHRGRALLRQRLVSMRQLDDEFSYVEVASKGSR
jgi:RNA polymerase sigma-70 factor, ECF subfamily